MGRPFPQRSPPFDRQHFRPVPAFAEVTRLGAFSPELSVRTSLIFAVVVVVAAAWQLAATDY